MATSKAKKIVKKAAPKAVKEEKAVVKTVETKPEVKEVQAPVVSTENLPSLKELLEAGAHFGHSVKRRNPRMDEYVYAVKNGVQIFDLVQTQTLLGQASAYLEDVVAHGGSVLLVGTKGQATESLRAEATRIGIPYITNRWVGGLFTNWEELKKRIDKLTTMKNKMEAGEYKKYTKKEQVLLKREIDRLERMYGGLVTLNKLPDAVFVIDPMREDTAVREAIAREIPIVAVCDSNCDPTPMKHVIPANDDAYKTLAILITTVTAAIERGMKKSKTTK